MYDLSEKAIKDPTLIYHYIFSESFIDSQTSTVSYSTEGGQPEYCISRTLELQIDVIKLLFIFQPQSTTKAAATTTHQ